MKKMLIFWLMIFTVIIINAQEEFDIFPEEDYPFEEPFWDEEIQDGKKELNQGTSLIQEQTNIGGSFEFTTTSRWEHPVTEPVLFNPANRFFEYALELELFLDFKLNKDFRTYALCEFFYPFDYLDNGNINLNEVFDLKELFVEFNWINKVFFKVGKQDIQTEEGYLFSPTDINYLLSTDSIYQLVSLRTHIPFQFNDIYLYLIANPFDLQQNIAVIPKIDFYFDFMDFSLSAYYKTNQSPKLILYNSIPFLNASINWEALLSYGSNKNFIIEKEDILKDEYGNVIYKDYIPELTQYKNKWFFRSFLELIIENNNKKKGINYEAAIQFFYNGEGYDDPDFFNKNIFLIDSKFIDTTFPGKYYLGMEVSIENLYKSGFDMSITMLSNLSDLSFSVTPMISYHFNKEFALSLSCPVTLGDDEDEYTTYSNSIEPKISIDLFNNTQIDFSVPLEFSNVNGSQELKEVQLKLETIFGDTEL